MALPLGRQFLAQPGHRTIKVVQRQALGARDRVILEPALAGPVRARDHDPMQDRGEDHALDQKRELAPLQKLFEHHPAAGLLPEPAEQQRRPDPMRRQRPQLILGKLAGIEPGAHLDRRHEARNRRRKPLQTAIGQHCLLPAEILDDPLLGTSSFAHALDEVQVGVAVARLLAHEHGELAAAYSCHCQP